MLHLSSTHTQLDVNSSTTTLSAIATPAAAKASPWQQIPPVGLPSFSRSRDDSRDEDDEDFPELPGGAKKTTDWVRVRRLGWALESLGRLRGLTQARAEEVKRVRTKEGFKSSSYYYSILNAEQTFS